MRLSRTLWVRIMLAPRCIANISHARELGSRFFGFGDPRKPPRKDLRETDTVTGMLPRFFNPPSTNRSLLICFELVFVKNGDFEACRKRYLSHANLFLVVFLDLQIQKTGSQVLLHVKCLRYSVVRALYAPTMYARVASWQIWHVDDHIQNRAF